MSIWIAYCRRRYWELDLHETECFVEFCVLLALGDKLLYNFIFALMICFKVAQSLR